MIWSFGIVITFVAALFIIDKLLAAPKYDANTSNHFDGKKFINPNGADAHHYGDVLKWWLGGNNKGVWEKVTEDKVETFAAPKPKVDSGDLHITFVNHATFLIQVDGLNILTDPIWSYRASPYQWIGPKRMRLPGIAFENLPPIDIVLISHNHYDHLDLHTVQKLHQQFEPRFVVPLGVEKFLYNHGITKTIYLDWWDEQHFSKLSLTAVPARHFSGRGLFDRNKTLWCGYMLHASMGNIYFAGDTGYGSFLKDISQKFGSVHTSLIPIGAYKPRWFMEAIHMSPEEAVKAHLEINSKQSFAMHYGTFPMADDGMHEPVEDLDKALRKYKLSKEDFMALPHGQCYHCQSQEAARI